MFAQKLNSYKLKSSCKLIILILLYLPIHSFGQDCVVHGLDEFNQWFVQNRRSIEEAELRFSQEKALRTAKMVSVPIQFHIVLDSGGNSELDEDMIDEAIENLNSYYEGANLSFFACGRPILLINSSFFEFDPDEEDALLEESYKDDVINIYCVNEMGNLNGYTYLPGAVDKDFIIIRSDRITTTTLPHEMGHYMGLKHTHGDQNCPSVMPATKELVNGSNCQTAGDQICDTPADPGMSGLECEERQYDSNCRYIGTSRDANGQLFKPDPKNIMSYAHPCRSYFSAGQSARMNAIFFEERSYLACQKEVDCDPPSEINLVDKDYSYFYIKWDDVSPTDTYSWRYRKQAESTWETSDEWESTGIVSSLKTPCTNYIFQVRSVCDEDGNFGDWSEELEFKTEGCSDSYCYSYGVAFGDWIKSVKFSNLESTSETNYGYVNLIDKIARVEPSKTYSLSLGAGYNTSKTRGDTYYWQVWIDFNQDNDFSDAGELVFSSTSSKASSVAGLSKDILIPASAKAGKTRMRVAMSLQSGESPCTTTETGSNFREVEDYSIEIVNVAKTLALSPNTLNFDAGSSSKSVTITSNTTWSVAESISWLSVSPISGSNNGTVNISCTANTSTSSRTGTITVSGSGVADQQISVTQNGASGVACSAPSNVRLALKGYSWFYIVWDKVPSITTYSVRYRKQSETTWTTDDAWGFDNIIYSIQSPCTDYVFQVRTVCGNSSFSDWSPELKFKTDGCNEAYCYSYGISYQDWIKEVSFAGIKNTSSSNYGYINLTNTTSAKVEVGKSYPLGLSAGFSNESNGDTYYWQVWIDFNQDNDFSDAGELVFSSTSPKASSVAGLSKDILIPTSAKVGKTRMRVAMSLQSGESPCTTTETGNYLREIEDYSVEIVAVAKTLALSPNTLNFDAGSSSKILTITSNTTWSVAESLSWLSVSPISGSNNGTVNISCTANISTSSRTGTITVSGSGVADQRITVTQAGVSAIACSAPTNLRNRRHSSYSDNIYYSTFFVYWDTVPGVKAYNLRMRLAGASAWNEEKNWTLDFDIYRNLAPNQRYEFQVQSICKDGSLSNWSPSFYTTTLGAGDPYCYSYGDFFSVEIKDITFGGTKFDYNFSKGYSNYTNNSTVVELGKSYELELEGDRGYNFETSPLNWRIWIDFNRDNDFIDPGEMVFETKVTTDKTTGKVSIPNTVSPGKTRMRVALDLDALNGPCSFGGNREVEDYAIEIKAANPTATLSVSPSSLAFTAANESKSFTITSNTAWTITESLSWLSVSSTSGSNNSTIAVTCDANATITTRTGTISISGTGVSTQSISITQTAGSATLSVSPLNLSFGAPGGNQTFSIKSNLVWSVSESLDWLSVNLTSGSNDGQVAITCANNPQTTNRTGSITVTGPGVSSQTITVTQSGVAPVVNVSPTTLNFTANGGSQSFNISANTNWTASESQDWLSLSPASGNNNASIAVTCSPNTSTSPRTGVITISGTTQTVSITQSGAAPAVCRAPSNLRNQITPDNPTNSISYSWFFVYWDAVPGATGYSARLRPVGSTSWREIKDVAVNQVDFRNLQPNTSFEVQVQSFCADGSASAWSSSLTTSTLGAGDPYCASYGDHQFGDINTVLLAGNALGGGFSQGYSFFKDKVYPLEKGRNYRLELVADDWQKSGEKPAYWRIWIDLNQDNDFNDPNELVFEAEGKNDGRVAGDLSLAANHSTGKTRMRIALDIDGQNGPCSTKGNRDVEDYLVEIRNPGDVWNEVIQTDQSHIIVLPQNLTSDIGGVALQENDQIGVFYTEKGVDYCAGKAKWIGNNTAITVYGDDLSSPQKDGFAAQEKFQIKVWQAQTSNEYKLEASYAPLGTYGITNAQGQFVNDGVSVVLSLGQNLPVAIQEISLQAGWNMISAYLDPKTAHLDSILQPIRPSLQLFKNAAGKSFIFSPAINDIGGWNSTEGYRLKVNKPETLSLSGQLIDPSLAVVPIRSGWQIVPYYGQQAVGIETALNGIRDKVVIVKNNAGAVYIPGELAINTIGNLEPGQGYLLKANADGQLRYSSSGLKPAPDLRSEGIPQHFQLPFNYNTGQNSTMIFPKTLLEKTLELNDEIGVFSPSGYLCGAARFTGDHLAISVWGDDASTAGIQGIQTNEAYTLQVWSNVQQKELPVGSSLSSLTYRENDVVFVQTLQVAISTHTLEEKLMPASVVLSPNPTDAWVQMYFTQNLSGKVNIRILALDGKILQQHDYPQGIIKGQSTSLDLSQLPRGMYQVQLRSASGWWTGKVSVMRP